MLFHLLILLIASSPSYSSEKTEYACTLKDLINFREISLATKSYLSKNHNYLLNAKPNGHRIFVSLCNKIDLNYLQGTNCSQKYFLVIDDGLEECTGLKWEELT